MNKIKPTREEKEAFKQEEKTAIGYARKFRAIIDAISAGEIVVNVGKRCFVKAAGGIMASMLASWANRTIDNMYKYVTSIDNNIIGSVLVQDYELWRAQEGEPVRESIIGYDWTVFHSHWRKFEICNERGGCDNLDEIDQMRKFFYIAPSERMTLMLKLGGMKEKDIEETKTLFSLLGYLVTK